MGLDVSSMQAAILVKQREPLVVDEVFLPAELAPGQVLVKIHFSGICGSQIGEIDGAKGTDPYLPHLLGHEAGGVVLRAGPGVRFVAEGDHVVLHWRKGQGIDAPTPGYRWQGKRLNAGWVTTFNQYAVVSENRLTTINKDFDLGLATLLGCALTTGLGVVTNNARLTLGESLVVLGAGGVGLSIIQGAAMVSAYPIVAVDLFDAKLQLARELGATHTINAAVGNWTDQIRDVVGQQGADVVVDNTGKVTVINEAYALTGAEGRLILVGVPPDGDTISIPSLPLHFGKTIIGSHGGEARPEADIPRYLRLWEAGRLSLDALITHRFPLDQINNAIDAMRAGEITGRCLINMD